MHVQPKALREDVQKKQLKPTVKQLEHLVQFGILGVDEALTIHFINRDTAERIIADARRKLKCKIC